MLNKKQKEFLKHYSSTNQILKFNIGKNLIDQNVINMINNALNKYELIKLNFLKSSLENKSLEEMLLDLSSKLHFDIIFKIGKVVTIYRENKKSNLHININV